MTRRPFEDPGTIQAPKPTLRQQQTPEAPKTPSMFDGNGNINGNAPKPNKEAFEQRASQANDRLNSYIERSAELIPLFLKMLNDKTLPENRSILTNDLEKEIIGNMMQLGLDMDADIAEKDGAGSIGLCVLLMKCLLLQRDKMNTIEYNLLQVKNELQTLKISQPIDNKTDK